MMRKNLNKISWTVLLAVSGIIVTPVAHADSVIKGTDNNEVHLIQKDGKVSAQYWCMTSDHQWKMCENLGYFELNQLEAAQKTEANVRKSNVSTENLAFGMVMASCFTGFVGLFGMSLKALAATAALAVGGNKVRASETPVPKVPDSLKVARDLADHSTAIYYSAEEFAGSFRDGVNWLNSHSSNAVDVQAMLASNPTINQSQEKGLNEQELSAASSVAALSTAAAGR